jgi:hypothetical protein
MSKWTCGLLLVILLFPTLGHAQDAAAQTEPPPSKDEKWQNFTSETFAPYLVIASVANAGVSHVTDGDPRYGVGGMALVKRLGAATADNVTENFFSDYVMASVLHEDTRYIRRGEGYGFWSRFGYAVSRGVITRTDSGAHTFNWANVIGAGISAGISNAYYPPVSRSLNANIINWANSVAGSGFGNLFPEFLPDFKRWLKRHHL